MFDKKEYDKQYYQANKHKWQTPEIKATRKVRYYANLEEEREKGRKSTQAYIERKRDAVGHKECLRCHKVKSSNDFARRRPMGGDGLKDICKPCVMAMRSERKREAIAQRPVPTEKLCPVCKSVKLLDEFYKRVDCKFGVDVACKPCKNRQVVDYHRKNPERKLECDRAFRAKNPEKTREYERRYKERFPEKVKAKKRAGHIRRKCRLKQVGGEVYTGADILELMAAQGGKCKVCEIDITTSYHVDHVIPISRGGTNEKKNIQLLCPTCNMSKGNKTMDEFMRHKSYRRQVCLQENVRTLTR